MKGFNLLSIIIVLGILGCEEIISVTDISEEVVTIQSPLAGTEIVTTQVQFSWVPIAFAESYQIQVATPSFSETTAVVLDTIVIDSLGEIRNFRSSLESDSYEWRIRATNSGYQTLFTQSDFSVNSEFEFSEQLVNISRPEDEFVTSETEVVIQWESIPQAEIYKIVVVNTETQEVLYELNTQDLLINIDFVNSGMYTYSIRAETATANTLFTSQTITIE